MEFENTPDFKEESKNLEESWMIHDDDYLRNYLTGSIQDPRFNPQSILSRYAIIEYLSDEDFSEVKYNELLFSAVMLWIQNNISALADSYERECLLAALKKGTDATETMDIPLFVKKGFGASVNFKGERIYPQYVAKALSRISQKNGLDCINENNKSTINEDALNVFVNIWKLILPKIQIHRGTVLEPACGSANDYRVLHAMGLASLIDYTGFDICKKNIDNALKLFPGVNFFIGDVYQYKFTANYDIIYVHDLFEHLSKDGIDFALKRLCCHCKGVLSIGFFNMDDIPDHVIRPVKTYHWNTLSLAKIYELISGGGFEIQIIHIETLLKELFNVNGICNNGENFYNPRAYSFICIRK